MAPQVDQNSEGGRALQRVLQEQLKGYLGADYSDDVLPLYIVVMLAHGTTQALVAENLEARRMPAPLPARPPPGAAALTAGAAQAFLGDKEAGRFADWCATPASQCAAPCPPPPPWDLHLLGARRLFTNLEEHGGAYAAQPAADGPAAPADGDGAPGSAAEPAAAREEPVCAACACPASLRPDMRQRSGAGMDSAPCLHASPGSPGHARLGPCGSLPCSTERCGPRVCRLDPERPHERRPRDGEREARGREERERSRKRERQRERIEWQGERPGEREEGPRSTDKRRREEPREERTHGRQAPRRARARGSSDGVVNGRAFRESGAPGGRGWLSLLPCAPCLSRCAARAGTAWVGAAPERGAADRAGGGAAARQGPGRPRRGRRARRLARTRAPPRARQVRRARCAPSRPWLSRGGCVQPPAGTLRCSKDLCRRAGLGVHGAGH